MLFDIEYHLPTLPNISSTEEYLYKPSQWEDEVVFSNYLGNLTPNEIFERITTIKKNKAVFSSTYSDLITLDNKYACFGKWFWEKKLFQSKLAYALKTKIVLDYEELKFPICENPFNRNSLFKYGNSTHMKKLFQEGEIYIPLAYNYKNDANEHRQDNELEKSSEYDFSHKSIIDKNHGTIPFQDFGKTTFISEEYYCFCLSSYFTPLYKGFNYDSCVLIHYPDGFIRRIISAIKERYGIQPCSFNDIMYYDKYEEPRKSLEPAFSKDIFYAWQLECRLVFPKICNEKFIKLKIGSIMDIAKFRYL